MICLLHNFICNIDIFCVVLVDDRLKIRRVLCNSDFSACVSSDRLRFYLLLYQLFCANAHRALLSQNRQRNLEYSALLYRYSYLTFSNDLSIAICKKCDKKKVERKEAIVELIQTEINYGQDLRILKEVTCA